MAIDHAEAEFDATTHVTKRTLLSDEAVQRICEAYLEARAELARWIERERVRTLVAKPKRTKSK